MITSLQLMCLHYAKKWLTKLPVIRLWGCVVYPITKLHRRQALTSCNMSKTFMKYDLISQLNKLAVENY